MDFFVSKYSIEDVIEMYKEKEKKRLLEFSKSYYKESRLEIESRTYKDSIRFKVEFYMDDHSEKCETYWITYFREKNQNKKFMYSEICFDKGDFKEVIRFDDGVIVIETNLDCIFEKARKSNRNDLNIEEKINKKAFEIKWHELFGGEKYEELLLFLKDGYEKGFVSFEVYEKGVNLTKEFRLKDLFK